MIQMLNKISNFFQIGNNSQDINIFNGRIDTSIKRLEKDFNNGNINQAMGDLLSLLEENKSTSNIKYHLLVKKASFLFSLRKYDEAINLMNNIETNYQDFLDISYEEVKLIVLSLSQEEKKFFELVDKIISESTKNLQRVNFELMYCLNVGNISKAKQIFDKLSNDVKQTKDIALIGGHIYSELYKTNSLIDYLNTDKYYQIALSHKISFLDKTIICGFYGTDIINKYMYKQTLPENYKVTLLSYQQSIDKILENEAFFENTYITNLKSIYLYLLLILNEVERYIDFFNKEHENDFIWDQHYFHYNNITNTSVKHQIIQDKVINDSNQMLLLQYLHLVESNYEDTQIILDFLENNLNLIYEDKFVLLFYVKGKLFIKKDIDKNVKNHLISNKYDNIEYLISFINLYKNALNIIKQEDVNKLLEMAYEENIISARITETLQILKDLGKRKEYLNLGIKKQNDFTLIIEKVFELVREDKDLLLTDFEEFILKLDLSRYREYIANSYDIYEIYDKSYEYYYESWIIEKEQNRKIDLSFKLLELARKYYEKYKGRISVNTEENIWRFLVSIGDNINLKDNILLSFYLLTVEKNIDEFLKFINKVLLNINIVELSHDIKLNLSALYFNLMTNYPNLNTEKIKENILYVKDGKYFINENYYRNIHQTNIKHYNLELKHATAYYKLEYNDKYEKKSLFHLLLNFVYELENPNIEKIEVNLETKDFSKMFDLIKGLGEQDKEVILNYSSGNNVPFYLLSKKEYRRYFGLIPELLENKEIMFDSGKPYLHIEAKKILTISSLIFIDYLGHLEEILKRDDIYIQQTLVNELFALIDELKNKDNEFSIGSDGINLYKHENSKNDLKFIIKNIGSIITEIDEAKIIDDTKVSLSIRESGTILMDTIGIQELQAIAYSNEKNYQIITEDRTFNLMFNTLKFNQTMVTNSISILRNTLNDDDMFIVEKKLHPKNYKSLLQCIKEDKLIQILNYSKFQNILQERHIYWFKIWYDYGCLDNIIHQYVNSYKVLYPKIILPMENTFSKNMKYLLKILEDNT